MKNVKLFGTKVYEVIVNYTDGSSCRYNMAITKKQLKKYEKGSKMMLKKGNTIVIWV